MATLKTLIQAQQFETLLKEKVDPSVCVVELARCKTSYGKPFYAYVRIKPSEYMDYKTKLNKGLPVDPNDYEILEYGWGDAPPQHVQEMMEREHGVDHQFESAMTERLPELPQECSVEQQGYV
jgi:hypothetical protein